MRAIVLGVLLLTFFSCRNKDSVVTEETKLPKEYQVSFGDPNAPVKITEYFSFFCPYCLKLFREEFSSIKEEFIDTGMVFWTFHPVPMDVVTIQGMDCLEKLSDLEKRAFLQVFLEEAEIGDPNYCTAILKKAMEVFEKPVPQLDDKEYLENTNAFTEAFLFVKGEDITEAVPSVEVNGRLYDGDVPDKKFVQKIVFQKGAYSCAY